MGTGGLSTTEQRANPNTFYSPVSFGGDIISGNVGNQGISLGGSSEAGGGSFGMDLSIPMPMQL